MYKFKNVPIATVKELFGLRPCSVNGRKAWFHCWVQTEHPYFLNNSFCTKKEMEEMSREIENKTIIPSGFKVEKIARVVALVEYDNGAVVKINPEEITFEDGRKTMKFEATCRTGRVFRFGSKRVSEEQQR